MKSFPKAYSKDGEAQIGIPEATSFGRPPATAQHQTKTKVNAEGRRLCNQGICTKGYPDEPLFPGPKGFECVGATEAFVPSIPYFYPPNRLAIDFAADSPTGIMS